jgi:hypothetical protein
MTAGGSDNPARVFEEFIMKTRPILEWTINTAAAEWGLAGATGRTVMATAVLFATIHVLKQAVKDLGSPVMEDDVLHLVETTMSEAFGGRIPTVAREVIRRSYEQKN